MPIEIWLFLLQRCSNVAFLLPMINQFGRMLMTAQEKCLFLRILWDCSSSNKQAHSLFLLLRTLNKQFSLSAINTKRKNEHHNIKFCNKTLRIEEENSGNSISSWHCVKVAFSLLFVSIDRYSYTCVVLYSSNPLVLIIIASNLTVFIVYIVNT